MPLKTEATPLYPSAVAVVDSHDNDYSCEWIFSLHMNAEASYYQLTLQPCGYDSSYRYKAVYELYIIVMVRLKHGLMYVLGLYCPSSFPPKSRYSR